MEMGGIKNRGTQVHKVKTKYKRNKKVEIPISKNSDDNFLEKTLAHIPEYFGKYGFQSVFSLDGGYTEYIQQKPS